MPRSRVSNLDFRVVDWLDAYQISHKPNWSSRGSPGPPEAKPATGWTVLKIWPKLGAFTMFWGISKFARLKILKISARNWTLADSPKRKLRRREKSQLPNPGPRRMFRPALPKVNALGVLKAEGSTHCCGVCLAG